MVQTLLNGAPFGSIGYCSFSGWIDTALFLQWLIHFQSQVKATPESKVLLILENHASHVSLPAINFCRKNNITMLSIPPSTSHRLQPLDRTFFEPLKTYYNQEIEKWLLNHPGRKVSHFDVVGIFNKAYLRSADVQKAAKGFKCTGIVPFNSHIFTDADFAAANVTDNQDEQPQVDVGNTAAFFPSVSVQVPVSSISAREGNAAETSAEETLDTSDNAAQETADNCNKLQHSSSTVRRISVTEILPLPKAQCSTRKCRGKKAELLTSTPQKKIMVEKMKKSNNKTKQSLLKKGRSGEWQCPMCSEPYINPPTEDWIQCDSCKEWCHEKCTSYDGCGGFVCDLCT